MKDRRIVLGYVEKRIHDIVRNVVEQVASGKWIREVPQIHLFIAPIPHQSLIDLAKNGTVMPVDAVFFLVGASANVSAGAVPEGVELPARQLAYLPVHLPVESCNGR